MERVWHAHARSFKISGLGKLMRGRGTLCLVVTIWALMGAQFRTQNFLVNAPTPEMAQQIGQWAEHYRKEKALLWVGQEMPPWPQPCPLVVQVTMEAPSGATSFNFGQGRVLGMHMEIRGPLDRLLNSVLPHEITHTVFAHHFRCPLPRWADEGGSVLSEDDVERDRHDKLVRSILNQGRQIPLRRLLALKEYPRDVMCLYAQGFSLTEYLVARSDRRTFLAFVGHGMERGWDSAVQSFYGHKRVEDLEETWLKHLRDTRRQPNNIQIAQNQKYPASANRTLVRLTVPPVQPLDPEPTVRGVPPTPEQLGQRFADPQSLPVMPPISIPTSNWQMVTPPPGPYPIQLGSPQFVPMPR